MEITPKKAKDLTLVWVENIETGCKFEMDEEFFKRNKRIFRLTDANPVKEEKKEAVSTESKKSKGNKKS